MKLRIYNNPLKTPLGYNPPLTNLQSKKDLLTEKGIAAMSLPILVFLFKINFCEDGFGMTYQKRGF